MFCRKQQFISLANLASNETLSVVKGFAVQSLYRDSLTSMGTPFFQFFVFKIEAYIMMNI